MCRTLAEKADTARAHAELHVKVRSACQLGCKGCKGCIQSLLTGATVTAFVCSISTSAPYWRVPVRSVGPLRASLGALSSRFPGCVDVDILCAGFVLYPMMTAIAFDKRAGQHSVTLANQALQCFMLHPAQGVTGLGFSGSVMTCHEALPDPASEHFFLA